MSGWNDPGCWAGVFGCFPLILLVKGQRTKWNSETLLKQAWAMRHSLKQNSSGKQSKSNETSLLAHFHLWWGQRLENKGLHTANFTVPSLLRCYLAVCCHFCGLIPVSFDTSSFHLPKHRTIFHAEGKDSATHQTKPALALFIFFNSIPNLLMELSCPNESSFLRSILSQICSDAKVTKK